MPAYQQQILLTDTSEVFIQMISHVSVIIMNIFLIRIHEGIKAQASGLALI